MTLVVALNTMARPGHRAVSIRIDCVLVSPLSAIVLSFCPRLIDYFMNSSVTMFVLGNNND